MKTWKWLVILVVSIVAAFLTGSLIFNAPGMRWMPLHVNPGRLPMMHGFQTFVPGFMLLRFLLPLIMMALIVAVVVLAVIVIKRPVQSVVIPYCSKCGKPIQKDWVNCPYCGEKLQEPTQS